MKKNRCFLWLFFMITAILNQLAAQQTLPQKLRFSTGKCNSMCGYENGFHDLRFKAELEYDLNTQRIRTRKKPDKPWKTLDVAAPNIFTRPETVQALDSLYQHVEDFQTSPGHYFIYRIELVYFTNKTGLPARIKTMEFMLTGNPDKIHPLWLEELIEAYEKVVYGRH